MDRNHFKFTKKFHDVFFNSILPHVVCKESLVILGILDLGLFILDGMN